MVNSLQHYIVPLLILIIAYSLGSHSVDAQPNNRIRIHDTDIFLSGGNVAWINFARDIGPGTTRLDLFEEMFREMHEHGGNSFRLWLHTNGSSSPEFNGTGAEAVVTGPGEGTIEDLRAILDIAYFYNIGLKLCLWSFDMLQTGQSGVDGDRNIALLTDDEKTEAYITNALIPMVDSLKGHPAILAWEIFNEPEGMTTQFGWTPRRVSMADVQRFVNLTAGAIRRTDPDVLITNGSWSFRASSDVTPEGVTGSFINYYRDDRLIEAGGDSLGYLDFYSVHYYEHFGIVQSPFHIEASFWQLDKPIVIAEFFLYDNHDQQVDFIYGVPWWEAYKRLYDRGYAGALGWQWFDNWTNRQPEWRNWPRILENIASMRDDYRSDVDLQLPGLRARFSVFPEGIEAGEKSTLTWIVRGAETVTLNDEPVAYEDTIDVFPAETTTYILTAEDSNGITEQWEMTVTVLDPMFVNRAFQKPVVASSIETSGHRATFVNDGNPDTRWSSLYQDDQWIYIDLLDAYDVHLIVLDWEVAYGASYNIDISFDGVVWETIYEEREGTGTIDSVAIEAPVPARFVRMHGLVRGTQWGFSLWEIEIYGILSDQQPPKISITAPIENAFLEAYQPVTIKANVQTGTSAIMLVDFFINDESVGSSPEEPYEFIWENPEEGDYSVYAVARDYVFDIQSLPRNVLISPEAESIRFEAENAIRTGSTEVISAPAASGGAFVRMQDATNSTLTWENIQINDTGIYGLRIGFRLPFDDPKGQHIHVNDTVYEEIMFTGPLDTWLTLNMNIELVSGSNTVMIEGYWGWMDFDYIEVRGKNLPVNVQTREEKTYTFSLEQNYPNPFNPTTTIGYTLGNDSHVVLEVYNLVGRKVAVLVDERQRAGTYHIDFDGSKLASGVYVYRLSTNGLIHTKRMILIK
jgi:hypothetical protein